LSENLTDKKNRDGWEDDIKVRAKDIGFEEESHYNVHWWMF